MARRSSFTGRTLGHPMLSGCLPGTARGCVKRCLSYKCLETRVVLCRRHLHSSEECTSWAVFEHANFCTSNVCVPVVQGYATFNDDIQATAAVTLGALMGAQRLPGVPRLRDQTFLLFGAGQANLGAAQLLIRALADGGVSKEDAKHQIWLFDSQVYANVASPHSQELHA